MSFFFRMVRRKRRRRACFTFQALGSPSHSFFPKIKWILEIRHFGYFSLGCFRYEFCHLWVRFWDGSWCVVNLKSYSFQNGYGYVQAATISVREAQLSICFEKHLKFEFWKISRFLHFFSHFFASTDHFGRRSSALWVWYRHGRWCVGHVGPYPF